MDAASHAIQTVRQEFRLPHLTVDLIRAEKLVQAPVKDEGLNHEHVIGAKISSDRSFTSKWRYIGTEGPCAKPSDYVSYVPADIPWGTTVSGQGGAWGIACRFETDYFLTNTGLDENWTPQRLRACRDLRSTQLRKCLDLIYAEIQTPKYASPAMIQALSQMLLIEMARYFRSVSEESELYTGQLTRTDLQRMRDMLYERNDTRVTVRQLSDTIGCSEGHFYALFKRETGITPHQFIEMVRIKKSIDLLIEARLSIKQIAHAVGFSGQSSFTVAFQRFTGRTPAKVRRDGFSPLSSCFDDSDVIQRIVFTDHS